MTNNNTLNAQSQVSAVAPVKSDKTFIKSDHFKTSDIALYFERVIGKKQLDANQTIRLTYDSYRYDADANGHIMGGVFTYKRQIASVQDLLKFMEHHTDNKNIPDDIKNQIGYSMSASVYECDPAVEEAPGLNAMSYTQSFVFDIDSRVGPDRKSDRYAFNNASHSSKMAAAAYLVGLINQMLSKSDGLEWYLIPSYVYETGGGLQLIFKYTDNVKEKDASLILGILKQTLDDALEKYKDHFKFYMKDILGVRPVYFEIDFSTFDVTHTQRIGGTRNPKKTYAGAVAKELPLVITLESITNIIKNYKDEFVQYSEEVYLEYKHLHEFKLSVANDEEKSKLTPTQDKADYDLSLTAQIAKTILLSVKYYDLAVQHYKDIYYSLLDPKLYEQYKLKFNELHQLRLEGKPVDQYTYEYYSMFLRNIIIPINNLIVDCKLATDKYTSENNVNSKIMDPSNIGTYELLSKLTPYQQYLIFKSRLKGEVKGSKYHKFLCPFHEEQNSPPSVWRHKFCHGASHR
jgi:hypothetical protein